ncbi:unnamed protein product [Amoebophrya sp. A25]|nr:unnamed protein product [Amoebophrya sp. A25]|eukprot:GSA25T00012191001.1
MLSGVCGSSSGASSTATSRPGSGKSVSSSISSLEESDSCAQVHLLNEAELWTQSAAGSQVDTQKEDETFLEADRSSFPLKTAQRSSRSTSSDNEKGKAALGDSSSKFRSQSLTADGDRNTRASQEQDTGWDIRTASIDLAFLRRPSPFTDCSSVFTSASTGLSPTCSNPLLTGLAHMKEGREATCASGSTTHTRKSRNRTATTTENVKVKPVVAFEEVDLKSCGGMKMDSSFCGGTAFGLQQMKTEGTYATATTELKIDGRNSSCCDTTTKTHTVSTVSRDSLTTPVSGGAWNDPTRPQPLPRSQQDFAVNPGIHIEAEGNHVTRTAAEAVDTSCSSSRLSPGLVAFRSLQSACPLQQAAVAGGSGFVGPRASGSAPSSSSSDPPPNCDRAQHQFASGRTPKTSSSTNSVALAGGGSSFSLEDRDKNKEEGKGSTLHTPRKLGTGSSDVLPAGADLGTPPRPGLGSNQGRMVQHLLSDDGFASDCSSPAFFSLDRGQKPGLVDEREYVDLFRNKNNSLFMSRLGGGLTPPGKSTRRNLKRHLQRPNRELLHKEDRFRALHDRSLAPHWSEAPKTELSLREILEDYEDGTTSTSQSCGGGGSGNYITGGGAHSRVAAQNRNASSSSHIFSDDEAVGVQVSKNNTSIIDGERGIGAASSSGSCTVASSSRKDANQTGERPVSRSSTGKEDTNSCASSINPRAFALHRPYQVIGSDKSTCDIVIDGLDNEHCAIAYHRAGQPYICFFGPSRFGDDPIFEFNRFEEIHNLPQEIALGERRFIVTGNITSIRQQGAKKRGTAAEEVTPAVAPTTYSYSGGTTTTTNQPKKARREDPADTTMTMIFSDEDEA